MLMMMVDQATETLEQLGLKAKVRHDALNECDLPQGRVIRSNPAPSSKVEPGTTVVIRVAGGSSAAYCLGPVDLEETGIALLDLARFGEGAPRFAPTVQIWMDGHRTRSLTAQQAQDPEAWGTTSPLTELVAATEEYLTVRGRTRSPNMWSMRDDGDQFGCGPTDPPRTLDDRESVVVTVDHSYPGPHPTCHWFRIYRNALGQVDAVTSATNPTHS